MQEAEPEPEIAPVDPTEHWEGTPFPELYDDDEVSTPVCRALARRASDRTDLVVVHHLHDTAESYVRALAEQFDVRRIVGIPYSTVPAVVESLSEDFDVVVPDSTDEIPGLVEEAVRASDERVVVAEIGGYCTSIAERLADADHVLGVVEDTNQGHWRWERADLDSLAVRSIATCELKRVEDSVVGKSIVDGLARYLSVHGHEPLESQRVHVIGYGNVGSATARHLADAYRTPTVYDADPKRLLLASTSFEVTERLDHADVVLGITGNADGSVRASDVPELADGALLVSASSRQVEFDVDGFERRAESVDRRGNGTTYAADGRRFTVANRGEPINLRYSRLPSRTLDLVYGALVACIVDVASGDAATGLRSISDAAQRRVVEEYLDCYDVQSRKTS